MSPEIITTLGTLFGGALGAGFKIIASLIAARHRNEMETAERKTQTRLAELNALKDYKKETGPDPNSPFTAWTRRLLALSVCWTFCAVVILWACFPSTGVNIPNPAPGGWEFSLLGLVTWSGKTDLATYNVSTGSIVWAMLPFMSMVLTTYFTPDLTKK